MLGVCDAAQKILLLVLCDRYMKYYFVKHRFPLFLRDVDNTLVTPRANLPNTLTT